jgi:hypothetical protein
VFTGAWFTVFGCGVLWWCGSEMRARWVLQRRGASGMARVLADPAVTGDHPDTAPLLSFHAEGHGEVVTRPRGWTTIRRTPALAADTLVAVAYDPSRPTYVTVEGSRQLRSDVFWLLLGAAFAACGTLLISAAL